MAYEDDGTVVACAGGVFISRSGYKEVFGCDVPSIAFSERGDRRVRSHVIGLVELICTDHGVEYSSFSWE